ncbi:hypothetical protein LCGC14_1474050 [marine sediment metagenome]|uniref:Uncharacterized protein n=1 Tax=marine sediment metagenome TaxID=412755 RepID=A0A0F9JXF2_9ZZZZ
MEVLPVQDNALVGAARVQHGALTVTALGEEQVQAKAAGSVPYFNLPPLLLLGESVLDGALDVEVLDVAFALGLAQRDEHVPAVAFLIAVHGVALADLVLGEDLAVAPGMVLEGDDVILQEFDLLVSFEDGGLAFDVFEFQGGVIVEDLVHALFCARTQGVAEAVVKVGEDRGPFRGEPGE